MSYTSLHAHTEYSNIRMLDSTNKITDLIDKALQKRLNGIAITDHESLSGHIKAINHFYTKKEIKLKQFKEEYEKEPNAELERLIDYYTNFRLILGNEIYLTRNDLNLENYVKGKDEFYHFILLAKDAEGHKQLRQLSSRAWSHSFRTFIERVPTYYRDIREVVGNNKGHLIASTACLGSEFAKLMMRYHETKDKSILERIDNFISFCVEMFGKENFFIELQASQSDDQALYNKLAASYARYYKLPMIVTTDIHYLTREDREVHKAYLNSNDGDREVDDFYSGTYMMDEEEIRDNLSTYLDKGIVDEVLSNTNLIRDMITEYNLDHKQIVPRIVLPPLMSIDNEIQQLIVDKKYINLFINSNNEQDKYYVHKILFGLKQKIDVKKWVEYIDRIEQELEEVWEISIKIDDHLSAYFNTMAKVIDIIWNGAESLVGISRGSAGGFVTNYLLEITQMDPLVYTIELPHWRFVHKDRPELPDVDIDFQASKRTKLMEKLKEYFASIGGSVYNIATFGTETAKAAIQTAARGLNYDSDLGTYLSSLIPVDRGRVRTLQECYYGDEEKGYNPIPQFVSSMNQYKDLWNVASRIEGLICRRGLHACGTLIVNEDFIEHNAIMKAPNKVECSQFDLHDSEQIGGLKFDALTTDALDRIRTTLDLLLKYDYIEWKDSLKATYDYYLSPFKLDYDNKEMWNMVGENKISNLFQYDTPVGLASAKKIAPQSVVELAVANSLMRLMADEGQDMPSDVYANYKKNIKLWYREMDNYNLTDEEVTVLEKHLKPLHGVADSQESIMMMSMDEKIANFTVVQANKLRKTIAKKKLADIDKVHQMFMEQGRAAGASDNLLNYVWDVQIKRQLGYSFSVIHAMGYSIIALQEMNLATKYPLIFWNCANLIVDSQGIDEEDSFETYIETFEEETEPVFEDELDSGEEIVIDEKGKKKKVKVINYGRISTAIGKMIKRGINVDLPDINKSGYTFTPSIEDNTILFGIKGIAKINDTIAKDIIVNRPYISVNDFLSKLKIGKLPMINLIKSGAFDGIENNNREQIMYNYIDSISDKKNKLTLQNMAGLIREKALPIEYDFERRVFNFNKYLKNFKTLDGVFYQLDEKAFTFYEQHFDMDKIEQNDDGKMIIKQSIWDKIYKASMETVKAELKSNPDILINYNTILFNAVWNKYASGSISKWEMDSVNFYYHEHELVNLKNDLYNISDFDTMNESPIIDNIWTTKDGKQIPIFKLCRIAGTVIDKEKNKNIITLLTTSGVVLVKVYRAQFSKYDKQISERLEDGKKKVIEKSWFTRGNKLIISGIRRENFFIPKIYKNNPEFEYPFELINKINEDGTVIFNGERAE